MERRKSFFKYQISSLHAPDRQHPVHCLRNGHLLVVFLFPRITLVLTTKNKNNPGIVVIDVRCSPDRLRTRGSIPTRHRERGWKLKSTGFENDESIFHGHGDASH